MHNSQEVANTIKSLLKSKNITAGQMLLDCQLSKNALSSMQSGGYLPRVEALVRIADYLDCSIDYLLGRTDIPEVNTLDNMLRIYTAARAKDGEHLDDNIQYVRETLIEKLRNAPASSDTL